MDIQYIEDFSKVPVTTIVDVLVIGGGPAGFSAAVNAARQGAKTLLIERSGDVGGVSTTGLMSHWTGETKGGFYEEIIARTKDSNLPFEHNIINTEKLKTEMLIMLEESKAQLKLYTWASKPIIEGNKVKGIIIEGKSGREAILSKVVIDASGDGDMAAAAQIPYFKGRESDGKMQPMTIMFKIAGVDFSRAIFPGAFEANFEVPKGLVQDLGKQYLEAPAGHVLLYKSTLPGVVSCNMTNEINVDGTNTDDLTRATIRCRKQMKPIIEFLRKYVPGYEDCFIISSASTIGVRETRHFEGEYTLQEEDILAARYFEDWVVEHAYFNFDIHNVDGSGLDDNGAQAHFKQKKGYTIPYRSLLPKKMEGILLSGRNIASTHIAHSNLRAMPICANIGQASGIAAALAAKQNISLRDVDPKEIQTIIHQQEVRKLEEKSQ